MLVEASSRATLSVALHAVSCAARLSRGVRQEFATGKFAVQEFTKDDYSPVTAADFGVQALITLFLQEHAPRSGPFRLVAEEDADALAKDPKLLSYVTRLLNEHYPWRRGEAGAGDAARWGASDVLEALSCGGDAGGAGRFWYLDPIDGTRGFVRGGHYAIGLGLVDGGQNVVTAVACPTLPPVGGDLGSEGVLDERGGTDLRGFLFGAVPEGALTMELDQADALDSADSPQETEWERWMLPLLPAAGKPGEARPLRVAESFAGRLIADRFTCFPRQSQFVRMDSMAKYCVVARGEADAYVRAPLPGGKTERVWDHAAALVVQAAGGRVTDFRGQPLDFSRGRGLDANLGVLATSAAAPAGLHASMLECALEVWPVAGASSYPGGGLGERA